jgi:hypothetical protein
MFDKLFVAGWRDAHKLWSVRLALFWGALAGAVTAFASVGENLVDPYVFIGICAAGFATIAAARVLKQPGLSHGADL